MSTNLTLTEITPPISDIIGDKMSEKVPEMDMHGNIIEKDVIIIGSDKMSCSEMQEGCKQCKMLLDINYKLAYENGTLKRGREVQRLKIREQAEEMQKMEEQIQEEINYSASMSEALKDLQMRRG